MKTIFFWFLLYNQNVDTTKLKDCIIIEPINKSFDCDYCMKIPYIPTQPINKKQP